MKGWVGEYVLVDGGDLGGSSTVRVRGSTGWEKVASIQRCILSMCVSNVDGCARNSLSDQPSKRGFVA